MSLAVVAKYQKLRRDKEKRRLAKLQQTQSDLTYNYNPYHLPESFKEFARSCQIRSGLDFIPFELFDYQVDVSDLFDQCRGLAILKTRQVGASELMAAKMLHRSLLNPAYLGVAFSLGQQESSKLSDRVGMMPNGVRDFKWAVDSKTARKSERGGELLFRPSTPNSARSLASVTDLFFDECGFPAEIEEMYGNATPAQSMVGAKAKRILATTIPPEGMSCWFGRTFWRGLDIDLEEEIERVQDGRGRHDRGFSYWIDNKGWARILLHWQSHPIYSAVPRYLENIRESEQITEDQLQREHNLGLPKDGASLFNHEAILAAATGEWTAPQRKHFYLATIDPNQGGNDDWDFQVWDITDHPLKLVAQWHESNRLPSYCRAECLKFLDEYDRIGKVVMLVVEKNNGGLSQAENFIEARPNLRVEVVNTSATSKVVNTDRITLALGDGDVVYPPDWHGIPQLKKFSRVLRVAIDGEKDDAVMSWAVGFGMLGEAIEELKTLRKRDISWIGRS